MSYWRDSGGTEKKMDMKQKKKKEEEKRTSSRDSQATGEKE